MSLYTDPLAVLDERVEVPRSLRAKVLSVVAVGPMLTGYAAVAAVLALVTAIAARAHFTTGGVLAASVPGWLAAYQVPVRIEGHELGALPLLPTLLVLVLVWRTAASAADRLDVVTPREAAQIVAAVAGAHGSVGLTLGLLSAGSPVTVDPLAGLWYPALLSGLAAAVGVLPRSGLFLEWADRLDPIALRGARVGGFATVAMIAVGAFVFALALVLSAGTVARLFAAEGPGGGLGMLLLSAGYLPNGVIAAAGFAAGPGFSLGAVVMSPVDFAGGPVPPLPLLGALPGGAAAWWPLLFAFPAAVGTFVGWELREVDESPRKRLHAVAVAAVIVAVAFAVLAGTVGGALAGGPFHPLDLRAAWLSVALVAWIGVPGGLVAWTAGPRPEPTGPLGLIDPEDEFADEDADFDDDDSDDDSDDDVLDEDAHAEDVLDEPDVGRADGLRVVHDLDELDELDDLDVLGDPAGDVEDSLTDDGREDEPDAPDELGEAGPEPGSGR
ncbi:DUF6350 family protein [Actinokineospora enzanensis]|uniref:cell division protein PerM n=1 Tax=Actinokineospora enzanensis TaxID=155975 RepID=UPI00036E8B66|nr:DUF6350 family protein [Actinokineospora enzanensis]